MGKVQNNASKVDPKKGDKPPASEEPEVSTRELLEVIKTQQEQISKASEEIAKIKEAHNRMVDALSEVGDKLEKGAGKGSLTELAPLIKVVAPLLRGEERSPFHDIGVFTFKEFLRSAMGKKMAKKAIKRMTEEEAEEEEGEEE